MGCKLWKPLCIRLLVLLLVSKKQLLKLLFMKRPFDLQYQEKKILTHDPFWRLTNGFGTWHIDRRGIM